MKHGLMIHVSVFLAAAAVGSIDTSGTSMLDELKKTLERRGMQVRAKAITLYLPCSELEESSECHGMNLVLNVLRSVVPFSDRAGEPWQRDDEEAGQLQGPGADRPRVDLPDGGGGRVVVRLRAALAQARRGHGKCGSPREHGLNLNGEGRR